eukprot:11219584-Lingulodinium_polyedra.AAC.2
MRAASWPNRIANTNTTRMRAADTRFSPSTQWQIHGGAAFARCNLPMTCAATDRRGGSPLTRGGRYRSRTLTQCSVTIAGRPKSRLKTQDALSMLSEKDSPPPTLHLNLG